MTTTVISLKGRIHDYGPALEHAPAGLVYVGRAQTMGGWRLKAHPLANPHTTRAGGCPAPGCGLRHDQVGAVRAYGIELQGGAQASARGHDGNLFTRARAAAGSTLACWCPPEVCHADVIAAIADAPGDVEAIRLLDAIVNDPLKVLRPFETGDATRVFLARIEGTACDWCEDGAAWEAHPSDGDGLTVCPGHLPSVNKWAAGLGRPVLFHDSVMNRVTN